MKGFLLGSLALIAFYALLQKGSADTATAAGKTSLAAFQRALSPSVAGVPNRAPSSPSTTEPPLPPSQGGPAIPIPGGP